MSYFSSKSCKTCAHFNASYRICDFKGEITRMVSGCSRWMRQEAQKTLEIPVKVG